MARNILIVDDSSIVRRVLRKALTLSGLSLGSVFEAENGQEALEIAQREDLCAIFLDINMPIMNGLEFLRIFRTVPQKGETPIVIISTEGSQARVDEMRALEVWAYLRKPVTPEMLLETVSPLLQEA